MKKENKQPVKNLNTVLGPKCSYCGSTRLEKDKMSLSALIVAWGRITKVITIRIVNNCFIECSDVDMAVHKFLECKNCG